jgi:GNAT superfamily N-acetyltransferase
MVNSIEFESQGYSISTDNEKLSLILIHQFLSQESYWAKNIPVEVVQRSINNSLCFGLYYQGVQIGFARLVTDKATFAYLADVFIIDPFRGKGLSKWLIQTIHVHPDLQGLRRWMLGTRDAHSLYAQFGWKSIPEDMISRFMQLHHPEAYPVGEKTP